MAFIAMYMNLKNNNIQSPTLGNLTCCNEGKESRLAVG